MDKWPSRAKTANICVLTKEALSSVTSLLWTAAVFGSTESFNDASLMYQGVAATEPHRLLNKLKFCVSCSYMLTYFMNLFYFLNIVNAYTQVKFAVLSLYF